MRFIRWFYTIHLRLRSLLNRASIESELDEEIRYHIERQIEKNISDGMSAQQARTAAMRAFGGVDQNKEASRDTWRVNLVGDLIRDLRYTVRTLRRSPGFTAVAVLSLGIG